MLTKTLNDRMNLTLTTLTAATLGFLLGTHFPAFSLYKIQMTSGFLLYGGDTNSSLAVPIHNTSIPCETYTNASSSSMANYTNDKYKIFSQSNPKGAEMLPPEIVVSKSDLYQRRLWGGPNEDLPIKPKYLVAFAVSLTQKVVVNAAVQKFSENFTILLFHYDGHVNEWDEFEWSKRAIHIGTRRQTKWWYAKRFLHPDIVAPYEYLFIWDEDLGVENFDAEEYINLVKKYGLEISQPGLESNKDFAYQITERRNDTEVHKCQSITNMVLTIKPIRTSYNSRKLYLLCMHKEGLHIMPLVDHSFNYFSLVFHFCFNRRTEHIQGIHRDLNQPPNTEFIEIMAPVFSKNAWRCVWHMIQNDLVHGWGLDFTLRKCVEPAREKMGVVDAQWVFHHAVPTLRNQGKGNSERAATATGIEARCYLELRSYIDRWHQAERNYYKMKGLIPMNSTENFTHFF
ncbi:uncharacterized protein LOC144563943 isoform X2 [Carex rostrata]